MRGQTVKRARPPRRSTHRVERLAAPATVTGPKRERTIEVRFPEPPRPGATVLEVDGLAKGYGGPPVFEDVDVRPSGGASGSSSWASTAPARRA